MGFVGNKKNTEQQTYPLNTNYSAVIGGVGKEDRKSITSTLRSVQDKVNKIWLTADFASLVPSCWFQVGFTTHSNWRNVLKLWAGVQISWCKIHCALTSSKAPVCSPNSRFTVINSSWPVSEQVSVLSQGQRKNQKSAFRLVLHHSQGGHSINSAVAFLISRLCITAACLHTSLELWFSICQALDHLHFTYIVGLYSSPVNQVITTESGALIM